MTGIALPPPEAAAAHPVPWMVYASAGKLQAPRHIRWIGEKLMQLAAGKTLRLVISCPPRHGKSKLIAEHFTSWWLGTHPTERVIYVTMQERFSRSWGRKSRDVFFQHAESLWGVTTWSRASTAEWDVFKGGIRTEGSMSSVGAGGTITGKGAHLLVIDDLIRNMAEAQNANLRETTWEWFQSACLTRLEPPGRVVILMTRWHHDDLIGRLMKAQKDGELGEEWVFLNLPAIAEEDDPMGRAKGEALWPERFPVSNLEKKKKDVGPYVWQSLYQGRPTPRSGNIYKVDWFKRYKRVAGRLQVPGLGTVDPASLFLYSTVDLAASKKRRADWTSISFWGFSAKLSALFLLHHERQRLEGHEIVAALVRHHRAQKPTRVYVERVGPLLEERIGSVLKEALRQGVPVIELNPDGDKIARALASTGPMAAGQVFFDEKAPYMGDLEEELLTFPDAKHDDQVDTVSYGIGVFQELVRAPKHEADDRRDDDESEDNEWMIGRKPQ